MEKKKHPDFKKLSDTKFVIPVYKKFLKVFDVPATEVFESEFLKKVHVAKKLDFKNALKKILSPINLKTTEILNLRKKVVKIG